MPAVKCPIPGCDFVTEDLESSVVAALLNVHSNIHAGGFGHSVDQNTRMKEINECVKDIKAKYFSRQPASKRKTDSEELEKPSRSKMLKKEKNDGDKDITIKLAYKVKSTTGLRRISSKSGGGVYELKLKKHESTYDCIKSEGEKYFLGGAGKCETHLELDGKQIDCFLNDNGDQCTYAEYLKTNHLFASRCKLYLVSSTSVEQSSSSVLASPKSLTILSENSASTSFGDSGTLIKNSSLKEHNQLKDDLLSVFSEDQVYITFQKDSEQSSCSVAGKIGMLELESSKNPSILDIDSVDINPLNYGYKVRKIVKYQEDGNKCFLDWKPSESGNTKEIVYPCAENKTNIILHGPDEVNGFEVKDYMLGIVVEHSQCCTIEWIRDGKIFKSDLGLNIIYISEPGLYYATVIKDGERYMSKAVCVLKSDTGELRIGHALSRSESLFSKPAETPVQSKSSDMESLQVPCISHADFQVGDEIGQGCFGTVFRGKWLGTDVAIKKIPISKKQRNVQITAFHKEISILSGLRHPNLVQIMAYSLEGTCNKASILMELVNGCDLETIIYPDNENTLELNERDKLSVSLQIAQGLCYLHGQKVPIIHQDIKPANILVSDLKTVKIGDLGIARLRTMQTQACKKTIGGFEGTPLYMSPECVLQLNKTTAASDIWSYGCTVLEMYTFKDIWDLASANNSKDDDIVQLQEFMKNQELPHGLNKTEVIPELILDLLRKCLSYDVRLRPSAIEIVEKVNHILDNCTRCCKGKM